MNRFFAVSIEDGKAILSEDDAYHLKNVLRAKIGEEFEVCDGVSREYLAELSYIDKRTAELTIKEEITVDREPKHRFIVCQGIPKGRKLDDVVRHATELGLAEFYPLITDRINIKNVEDYDKTERMQRVADEAAKQSKRLVIPTVHKPIKLSEIVKSAPSSAIKLIAWEEEKEMSLRAFLKNVTPAEDVYIIVGPEGGLTEEEVMLAKENGFESISLGKRILRTETAPLALLAAVSYELCDLE